MRKKKKKTIWEYSGVFQKHKMVKVGRNNLETIVLIFVLRLQEINNNNKKVKELKDFRTLWMRMAQKTGKGTWSYYIVNIFLLKTK